MQALHKTVAVLFIAGFGQGFGMDAEAAVRVYRPADASQVILRVDTSNGSSRLATLKRASETSPTDASALESFIAALVAMGASSGNERYYGYAEKALLDAPHDVQAELALLHASLMQHRHDFVGADNILTTQLTRNARDLEARLMRAQIRVHLHKPKEAMQDCVVLAPLVDILTSSTCIAQARAGLGDLKSAYALVSAVLQTQTGATATRSWSAGLAAELATRLGNASAGKWYRIAYELDTKSHYARISYTDWLLANGQFDAAHSVAKAGKSNADRLRVALALRDKNGVESRRLLLAWHEATLRGERNHLRDQARFELEILHDSQRALVTALDNFIDHREAADALILAAAAIAVGDRNALNTVDEWQTSNRYQDARLSSLISSL
ncbi:MAG: hypothetical protein H7Y02_09605 [Candidatus Obscuribacterales bacterium]|nr:hypothetical protein [Steroidobacteraceae bacterium]